MKIYSRQLFYDYFIRHCLDILNYGIHGPIRKDQILKFQYLDDYFMHQKRHLLHGDCLPERIIVS